MATARVVKDIRFTTNLVITTRHSEGTVIQSNIITCSLSSRRAPVLMVNSDRLKCQVKWKYTNIYYTELSTLPLGTTQSLWQLPSALTQKAGRQRNGMHHHKVG